MKLLTSFLLLFFLSLNQSFAAQNPIVVAMKEYEKRHYDKSIRLLQPLLNNAQSNQELTRLSYGLVLDKNARFHKALYEASIESQIEYLEKLSIKKGKQKSSYVNLFLGEAYIQAGKYSKAKTALNKFLKLPKLNQADKNLGKLLLIHADYKLGKKTAAKTQWNQLRLKDVDTKSTLLAIYSAYNIKPIATLMSQLETLLKKANKPYSSRLVANSLAIFLAANQVDHAIQFTLDNSLDVASIKENIGDSKQINFYDISILNSLAELYHQASIQYLQEARKNPKYTDTALFYQTEASMLFKRAKQTKTFIDEFKSSNSLPTKLSLLKPVKLGAVHALYGKKTEAGKELDHVSSGNTSRPEILADILTMCAGLQISCAETLKISVQAAAVGQGARFRPLNAAIGQYFLSKNKSEDALKYLELARDKSNKNKVEANDGLLLVDLSEAHRLEKNYSENLEIYFELSKHFPVVRVIQEAVQGTYSMEHRSAGDVKIF
ncbi:MAG: hypothetical protein OEZ58_19200 [Gammaproteobacteria bacterium]|nr:hypothetical protein [Gammaproteobacteria bacterium]